MSQDVEAKVKSIIVDKLGVDESEVASRCKFHKRSGS